jgi:hypothetical protein
MLARKCRMLLVIEDDAEAAANEKSRNEAGQ